MKTFLYILLASLLGSGAYAYADEPSETIQHSCDGTNKQFKLHYQIYWNEPAPSGKEFSSEAGKSAFSCKLGNTLIRGNLILYSPSAQGMCGGLPGGQIESLQIGKVEILNRMPMNSCYSSWLDYVLVQSRNDIIKITFCGSHYQKDSGEKKGCFTEHFPKTALPKHLYSGSNFPFEKYQPDATIPER